MEGPKTHGDISKITSASLNIKFEAECALDSGVASGQYARATGFSTPWSDRRIAEQLVDNNGPSYPQSRENRPQIGESHAPYQQPENTINVGLGNQTNKIKQIIEAAISPESKQTVSKILDQVNQLSIAEKLLLYLKLPTGRSQVTDPLRQPLNPLGSRFEIHQTITWIRTHLEEDPDISLPKQDVYDEYMAYCESIALKPLSTADFGKVMKQVFPRVRPRRLGTRGNSRYCYAGMRKRAMLETPQLPDLGEGDGVRDEVSAAAACLVREWAEKLLAVKFDNLRDLACHLVSNLCVDSRSVAAFTLMSSMEPSKYFTEKDVTPLLVPPSGQVDKHRETQLQLQRKLQEREVIREQKRKLQAAERSRVKRPKPGRPPDEPDCVDRAAGVRSEPPSLESQPEPRHTGRNSAVNGQECEGKVWPKPGPRCRSESLPAKRPRGVAPLGDSPPPAKLPIPRLVNPHKKPPVPPATASLIILPPVPHSPRNKYKPIQPKVASPPGGGAGPPSYPERDALDDYLTGGGNSQEQEEELLRYFQQDGPSQLRLLLESGSGARGPVVTESPTQVRRRVSFETSVPPSPDTRRRTFDFTPIGAGPHSPLAPRGPSKPPSADASPFVSPRHTPGPRGPASRPQRSLSVNTEALRCLLERAADPFAVPGAPRPPRVAHVSQSAPQSPLVHFHPARNAFHFDEPFPTLENNILNLKSIQPATPDTLSQEVSGFFPDHQAFHKTVPDFSQLQHRSQSVPLHRPGPPAPYHLAPAAPDLGDLGSDVLQDGLDSDNLTQIFDILDAQEEGGGLQGGQPSLSFPPDVEYVTDASLGTFTLNAVDLRSVHENAFFREQLMGVELSSLEQEVDKL